ncbi:hypothetical protein JRO89_XS02G0060500 [Xanthoceras sorbifolium]|uniref:DNA-directed RNA polymerase subunit n=1 Tax=Xanthoceras sorbifolium TaxID=99658 RepID=A0ABQ8IET6_9ROSI|nr:hypothetical protein JRO89_XS02G0060500 [Xanthoceras sorbifolium]
MPWRFRRLSSHYGYLNLAAPVYDVGYMSTILDVLKCICKSCSRILLDEKISKEFLKKMRNPNMEGLRKSELMKSIFGNSYGDMYFLSGMVKKAVSVLGIIHDRAKVTDGSLEEFKSAIYHTKESKASINVATYMLNPIKVLHLFKMMIDEDCEMLYLSDRPEKLIITNIAVPPVIMDGSRSNENDITERMKNIIQVNASLRQELLEAMLPSNIQLDFEDDKQCYLFIALAAWDTLQFEVAQYINSDVRGIPFAMQASKPLSGFVQRLKGKQGRFRCNLNGKRVEYTGRTVISPDPNLKITEVAIPIRMAQILTSPERVSDHNLEKLKQCVRNGLDKYPGARMVRYPDGTARQDSQLARIMPWRTLRFNESVCNPYNADFDGDEMNMHVPQTEETRTKALMLMGVQSNLCTPKNGEILVAPTQDFLTSSFIITRKDTFYDRAAFSLICCYMGDGMDLINLPTLAILKCVELVDEGFVKVLEQLVCHADLKISISCYMLYNYTAFDLDLKLWPIELWTGKQIFSVLLRPRASMRVYLNLTVKEKTYSNKLIRTEGDEEIRIETMCPNDGFVYIRNSELIYGQLGKATLGEFAPLFSNLVQV